MVTLRLWMQESGYRLLHFFYPDFYIAQRCDELPDAPHPRRIYLVGESAEPWLIAFQCPCGCKNLIQLNTLKKAKPRWTYERHRFNRISLAPSVWRKVGCGSHFWIKKSQVSWA